LLGLNYPTQRGGGGKKSHRGRKGKKRGDKIGLKANDCFPEVPPPRRKEGKEKKKTTRKGKKRGRVFALAEGLAGGEKKKKGGGEGTQSCFVPTTIQNVVAVLPGRGRPGKRK